MTSTGPRPDSQTGRRQPGRRQPAAPLLELPAHALVVLAGLPGAGKTTLLRRLADTPGVQALDSEDVAARLARLPVPYRWLRPLVHTLHLVRVALAVHTSAACILTTDPCTSPARRRLLRVMAGAAGRQLHVTLVAASAEQARAGREQRGRDLPAARVARHESAYDSLLALADHHMTRDAAARCTATVTAGHPDAADPGATPHATWRPPRPRLPLCERPAIGVAAVATALGLWSGVTAHDVSPVLEGPGGVGITPVRALFEALPQQPGDDLLLVHRLRSSGEVLFRATSSSAALPGLADAVRTSLQELGLPAEQLHEERFDL